MRSVITQGGVFSSFDKKFQRMKMELEGVLALRNNVKEKNMDSQKVNNEIISQTTLNGVWQCV